MSASGSPVEYLSGIIENSLIDIIDMGISTGVPPAFLDLKKAWSIPRNDASREKSPIET